MATEETRTLLDHLRDLHHELALHYHRLAQTHESERLKLLLDYLGEHEERLSGAFARYKDGADQGVLDVWHRWLEEPTPSEVIQDLNLSADASEDDVVEAAMKVTQAVIDRYRTQAEAAPPNRVGEALRSVIKLEEKALAQLARDTERLRDL